MFFSSNEQFHKIVSQFDTNKVSFPKFLCDAYIKSHMFVCILMVLTLNHKIKVIEFAKGRPPPPL